MSLWQEGGGAREGVTGTAGLRLKGCSPPPVACHSRRFKGSAPPQAKRANHQGLVPTPPLPHAMTVSSAPSHSCTRPQAFQPPAGLLKLRSYCH